MARKKAAKKKTRKKAARRSAAKPGQDLATKIQEAKLQQVVARARREQVALKQKELQLEHAKRVAAESAPGPWHKTQGSLARALGRSDGWVTASKRKPGAPRKHQDGWDESEWIRWMHDEAPTGHGAKLPPDGSGAEGLFQIGDEAEAYLTLLEDGADPLEMCRAAMQLAGLRMAASYRRGSRMTRELPDFMKSMDALRKARASQLKLDEQMGKLVSIDVARVAGAALARGFVRALTNFETSVAAQVETWISDKGLAKKSAKDRKREVSDWVRKQSREARELARGGLMSVIDEAVEDEKR